MLRDHYRAAFVSMNDASSPAAPAISLDFLPSTNVRIEAVAAHRGLAFCVGLDTPRRPCYYVCKPATRQWRAIPNPRTRFHTAAMAMAARPSSDAAVKAEFKIVRFSIPKRLHDMLHCEVFDSRLFAWRRAPDVPVVSLPSSTPAVRAHGAHALAPELDETRYHWACKQLSAVAGRLCLLVTTTATEEVGEVLEVWEMASYVEGRWEKKMTVSLKSLQAQERTIILRHLYSSDVGFLYSFYRAIWYDFRRGKKAAEVKVDQMCIQQVFKFESDMIPCMIGNGKACHPPAACAPSKEEVQR
ncbi:hypothetical protein HU200_062069 [Digitaria exilis]|uniref:F-box associated domain-containing protein n=1 Tax=Digitaria exilis TaxID=1010633 RepID=A0A835A7T0_9POAL|nr:hypothetical protein HU200_062069 [Digitaria exilis]